MFKPLTGFQVKLFESCYSYHYSAVGIVGPSAEIISSLHSHENYTIILIDNASKAVPKILLDNHTSGYKLQTFLIPISTVRELNVNLQYLKTLQWWNHMASFLIIDNSTSSAQDCSRAFKILLTAWTMNLLHAKFICHHESKGILIYSYNPYTSKAPIPWQLQPSPGIREKHPWTLFVCSYQKSQEICKALDFDQTKDLGGYKIHVGSDSFHDKNSSRFKIRILPLSNRRILHHMIPALNSTFKLFLNKNFAKLLKMTYSGDIDIMIRSYWNPRSFTIYPMTYPQERTELAVITQHRGYLSQIEKLLHVVDRSSRYAVVIACFITFVFFKFFLQQSITTAFLSIVRLICNAAVPNLPNNLATRIYLSGLFICVITLQGIYQGKLASLLTKPVALPNVETFEDLENFNYTIYGYKKYISNFKNANYSGSLVPLSDISCVNYVLRNDSVACLRKREMLHEISNKYDLHLSDTIFQKFRAFNIRKDWPLEKRWNILMSRLVESHTLHYYHGVKDNLILEKQKFYVKEKEYQDPKVITLKNLAFAFAILGIGLAGATVVFFVEVWKGRK